MSDSAHQGDAARLEAALDRIVRALDRAVPANATPDAKALEQGAAAAGADVAPGARRLGHGPDIIGDPLEPAGVGGNVPLAEIGTRLDGLIADLRDVLGEARPLDAAAGTDQPSGGQAPPQPPADRPGAVN